MASVTAKDISRWQGKWQDTGEPIVLTKMSGGDDGLYMDPEAANNYQQAVNAGKAVGGYHFAGGTNPEAEATYFMQAMSPLAENDVYALDWEVGGFGGDPVAWCLAFVNTVHDKIGVWPLIYMNLSTLNAHDWSPVLQNCGLWLADWNNDPNSTIPTIHTYVMQQYSDGPTYDHDMWFGTVEQFKKYGYHAPQPAAPAEPCPPEPTPEPPTPPVEPQPEPVPTPTPEPSVPVSEPSDDEPVTIPVRVIPKPTEVPKPIITPIKRLTFWQRLAAFIRKFLVGV